MNPQSRVYYEWSRLAAMEQWWQYAVLAAAVALIIGYIVVLYRRDWIELPRGLGLALLFLRIAAFGGLLLFFLNLQKRSEQPLVRPSRLAVLVDSSLSMTLPAGDAASESGRRDEATFASDPEFPLESRIEQIVRKFSSSDFLKDLVADHELSVYRFESGERPVSIASFAKTNSVEGVDGLGSDSTLWTWRSISIFIWAGTVLLTLSLITLIATIVIRLRRPMSVRTAKERRANILGFSEFNPDRLADISLAAVVASIAGIVFIGAAALRGSDYAFTSLWSFTEPPRLDQSTIQETGSTAEDQGRLDASPNALDWATLLTAQGSETRLGDAIATILAREQNAPLAGIVLLTDGQNNSGLSVESAAGQAAAAGIPLHVIGLGSALDPVNVRLVNVDAPRRVFPGDRFRISATLQATGLEGRPVTVQLRRRGGAEPNASSSNFAIEQEKSITLASVDEMSAIDFEVMPQSIGTYSYDVKVLPPSQDVNEKDDSAETDVEVIEPKSTVLVFAGGPTREYQFVRNLLFRDSTIQSHVFLQTGGPGMSQESDELLTEFPATAQEMARYDCVLCFDADFMQLEAASIDVLEQWVSSGAGGLVIVAGPVCTPEWTGSGANTDPRAAKLRDMAPVVLNSQASRLVSLGRFEGESVWPLKLTNESLSVDFMDVANSRELSAQAWDQFAGVYSFYNTYELKPGATAITYFSDPTTSLDAALPIYSASHFYGGGRVVFQGSGEIWRLREVDENYFNTYWTKLVRWSAQGRLLRDSDYGLLLVDKEAALLGDQISVRAVLRDQQFRPLEQSSVTANLVEPNGRLVPLTLSQMQGTGQAGVFVGQFLLRQTGKYLIRLDSSIQGDATLTAQVISSVPTREIERPKRNDPVLLAVSQRTGGSYFAGITNAMAGKPITKLPVANEQTETLESPVIEQAESALPIHELIPARDQVNFLPGAPDRDFQQRWMLILMLSIASALSLEWLLRRLSRLA